VQAVDEIRNDGGNDGAAGESKKLYLFGFFQHADTQRFFFVCQNH